MGMLRSGNDHTRRHYVIVDLLELLDLLAHALLDVVDVCDVLETTCSGTFIVTLRLHYRASRLCAAGYLVQIILTNSSLACLSIA